MPVISKSLIYLKGHSKIWVILLIIVIGFLSLKIYHHTLPLPDGKWISSNLEKIEVKDPEQFSFAVFGGNRFGRHVFEGMLKQVDHDPDIAFTIDLGDAVLKGGRGHYHHLIKQIDHNLGIPLLTVMGDNEFKGGRELYQDIFGPLHYSFNVGKSFFIVIDTVEEDGVDQAQMGWLKKELEKAKTYNNRVIFMHRPLYDPQGPNSSQSLPEEISSRLIDLFQKYDVTHLFASDINGYYEGNLRGIPYAITGGTGEAPYNMDRKQPSFHFLEVHVEKDTVKVEVNNEFSVRTSHRNILKNRAIFYWENMVMIHWLELVLFLLVLFICMFFVIRKQRVGKKNEE